MDIATVKTYLRTHTKLENQKSPAKSVSNDSANSGDSYSSCSSIENKLDAGNASPVRKYPNKQVR